MPQGIKSWQCLCLYKLCNKPSSISAGNVGLPGGDYQLHKADRETDDQRIKKDHVQPGPFTLTLYSLEVTMRNVIQMT